MSSSSVSLGRNLVSLKWEDFNMFVVSELSALYQKDDLTDVTLFCEGRSFRAHKVLLSLWSSYFRDIFRSTTHSHPVVILKETSSSDLELILRFIYQGHLLIPIEETDRFLKTAEHFQVAGLKNMRNHVPNFSYSSSGSTSNIPSSFHDENTAPQQHQQHVHSSSGAYEGGAPGNNGGASINTGSSMSSQQHQQQTQSSSQHYSRASSSGSVGSIVAGNNVGAPAPPPHPPHTIMPLPAESPNQQHHQSPVEGNNHQQVIRQGSSSRSVKHVSASLPPPPPSASYSNPSPVGFQPTAAAPSSSSGSGGVGVVTRIGSESVIYQPQPVLIFQNGLPAQGGVPLIKEQQYLTRSVGGEGGRQEHSMMVIEGVISDSAVHIESSTSSHNPSTAPYTVYHSAASPAPNPAHGSSHHSSPEVQGSEEVILGLPYNAPPPQHPMHREIVNDDPPQIGSQSSHHHTHSHSHVQQAQHISHHHHAHSAPPDSHPMETDTSSVGSVVVSHPYTPSSSSYESPIPNGSASSSSSNSSLPPSTKVKATPAVGNPDPPPVYAVKRIPPPLPPSNPSTPPSSRSFKSSTQIKNSISSPKSKASSSSSMQGHQSGHNMNDSGPISTRSKSSSGGVKVLTPSSRSSSSSSSSQMNASTSSSLSLSVGKDDSMGKSFQGSSSSSNTPANGSSSGGGTKKVVFVSCPKCGKKVKQTSLKVHMKRTHLEEGTVLVCPICSKRISSKGVYYKHMYIHRKRSETVDVIKPPATAASLIKSETQGT